MHPERLDHRPQRHSVRHGRQSHLVAASKSLYKTAATMAPLTTQQSFELALQHHMAGRLQEAEALYRQILAQQPKHYGAIHLLGVIAHQTGRLDAAVDLIRLAISLHPDFPEAHANLAGVLNEQGKTQDAIAACRKAIILNPNLPEAHNNLGSALKDTGQLDEAIAACQRAIDLRPNYAEAFNNLANALKDKGDFEAAIAAYRKSIDINPNIAKVHSNLANALKDCGQLDESIAAHRRAVALSPNLAGAIGNLASALKDAGQLDEAIAAHRQALALKPDYAEGHSALVFELLYHADYTPAAIADEHRLWDRRHAEPLRQFIRPHTNRREPNRRLRIGYVSPDFREHSLYYFVEPLFRHHDHGSFEIVCYSDVPNPDKKTAMLRAFADKWHSIVGLSDDRVAAKIRDDKIDILVDLAGHTAGNRLLVFARKPAPVQVNYQGYPATTGLTAMDYRITDALVDPPGMTDSFHSEKLWRLPTCNWCFAESPDAPPVRSSRPDSPMTFGSFNYFAKASPMIMDLWAAVLLATPASRLILKSRGLSAASVQQRIHHHFQSRGISPDHIQILGSKPDFRSHLDVYNQVDIALDSFPYHGTTTTCQALWMGVPVITLTGPSHVSRVGLSLLTTVGLPDLIAPTPEEYIRIATALANDLPRLTDLRQTLRQRMRTSPLMDGPSFTRDMESAYRQMWQTWCEGKLNR
jgi:protein O-GlcNAc transferase